MLNRQQPFGADVITRVSATMMDPKALGRLQERAHETFAELTDGGLPDAGVEPREVYEITVCGNQTMMQTGARDRSRAAVDGAVHRRDEQLPGDRARPTSASVCIPRAPAFVFPSLGAYVGGDIVAGMLATGMTRDQRLRLFIDVGTNSEIALGSSERVLATAAPAGPAFEAAQIKCGMRAADGAIEGVKIDGDELRLQVIGDVAPVGMCGSGLVDVVAELVHNGLLDHSGRFCEAEAAAAHPGSRSASRRSGRSGSSSSNARGTSPEESVFISQRDVRELQFAKASIATGWQILLRDLGVEAVRHPAGAARRQLRRLPHASERGADRARARTSRCRGSSQPATSPARARRSPRCRRASAPRPTRSCVRSSTSSCPAAPTSTTCSSTSSRFPDERVAGDRMWRAGARRPCDRARRRGWDVDVHPVPALLHNRPERIPAAVAAEFSPAARRLRPGGRRLRRLWNLRRRSTRCLGVRGRAPRRPSTATTCSRATRCARRSLSSPAPTSSPTSSRAPSSTRSCASSASTATHQLVHEYFRNYTRVIWLAQRRDAREPRGCGARGRGADRAPAGGAAGRQRGLEQALERCCARRRCTLRPRSRDVSARVE